MASVSIHTSLPEVLVMIDSFFSELIAREIVSRLVESWSAMS